MPSWRCSAFSSLCICSRSFRSSAPSGSSSSSTCGWLISARASATRWRWPPDSCAGRRSPTPASCTSASSSSARRSRSGLGTLAHHQRIGDVVADAHVREQRVVLEHGVHRPRVRRAHRHVVAADQDAPGGGQREAADHAQAGGLARARRPEQGEELAGVDRQVDAVDGAHGASRRCRRRRRRLSRVTAAVIASRSCRRADVATTRGGPPSGSASGPAHGRVIGLTGRRARRCSPSPTCDTARTGRSAILHCDDRRAPERRSSRTRCSPGARSRRRLSSALPLHAAGTDGTEPNQADRSPCSLGFSECSSHM